MIELTGFIGFLAGTLTTIAFIPQLVRIWRRRSAEDVSLAMFLIFTSGVLLWLWYGVLIGSWPIILTNSVTAALAAVILVLKVRYSRGGSDENGGVTHAAEPPAGHPWSRRRNPRPSR